MKSSKEFYKELGAERLAARKKKSWTKQELNYLKKFLKKDNKILDLACGYGRYTILLAKQGYQIEGLDISPNLLKKAKEDSVKQKLNIRFVEGDMKKLPYGDGSFGAVICMWSAFAELYRKPDQIKSLREMFRVLKKGGFCLIELPHVTRKEGHYQSGEDETTIKKHIARGKTAGIEMVPYYLHDKVTLKGLMEQVKPKKYKIFIDNFGGRKRLFLQFWK